MSNTVAARVKPLEADAPQPAPQTAKRTVTYPLHGGGFIAAPCPSWCTTDHSDDAEKGINPGDLLHQGDKVALPFELADGSTIHVLSVRIEQYPFAHDGESDRAHAALVPSEDDGEATGYLSASELHAEILRARRHLSNLQRLAERLAEARMEQHTAYHASQGRDVGGTWSGFSRDDVATMPVWYLLQVFRATVAEVDVEEGAPLHEVLTCHPDGTHTVSLDRRMTQAMREQTVRALFDRRLQSQR